MISIGAHAFTSNEFTTLTIPNNVQTIGEYAFSLCEKLRKISLGSGITSIGTGAFSDCSELEYIKIPEKVTAILHYTFSGCENLRDIDLGNNITFIGQEAFRECSNLKSLNIPNSVTQIRSSVCEKCDNLTTIKIGTGVKNITGCHLINHSSIQEVYCYGTTPPEAGSSDFTDLDKTKAKLYIQKGSTQAYQESEWGKVFDTIIEMDE